MDNGQLNWIANFIWGIADDVLRDVYVRGKYRDVILPMVVIRRLDAVLEPTKDAVLKMKANLDKAKIANQDAALRKSSGQAFYNASPFTLKGLKNRGKPAQLKADFETYLDGFSDNVKEILQKFKFHNQIPTLHENDLIGAMIEKFLDRDINLGPTPVKNDDGSIRLPALDNHGMGTVFEELIRRFNEENNEEAGEHFTPRDVVALMAGLIFLPIADQIQDATYTVYDGACGTGGMLTVAETRLRELAKQHKKEASIHLYGQEVNAETYAITKADLLLKGEGSEAENFRHGSTLSADGFVSMEFDFMLSNPPYGKSWKTDLDKLGGKDGIKDPRFIIEHAGDPEYSLLTRSSDGQLLFLVNKLTKMKQKTPLGSRIAEVHNGSSLFTGDAGQGESNIRRWIIENDWLEAIIALPLNMFYNTGIATYIWVLTNRKPKHRKGKVQLIDATEWFKPLPKNLGKKNCEFSAEDIKRITDLFVGFKESPQSKIFPNEAFGYWKITVERPVRLAAHVTLEKLAAFKRTTNKALHQAAELLMGVAGGSKPHMDFNIVQQRFEAALKKTDLKLRAPGLKAIYAAFTVKDETAEPVIKKKTKERAEYEPDADLRDTEQVPLLEEGGIEAFFKREVLPHVPDAWIDHDKTQTGYEISFTRHFYKPTPLRTLDEIRADLAALQQEAEGLLGEIVGVNHP
jgi:type I restriction enzyme M protein